jgi:hypothetical protein
VVLTPQITSIERSEVAPRPTNVGARPTLAHFSPAPFAPNSASVHSFIHRQPQPSPSQTISISRALGLRQSQADDSNTKYRSSESASTIVPRLLGRSCRLQTFKCPASPLRKSWLRPPPCSSTNQSRCHYPGLLILVQYRHCIILVPISILLQNICLRLRADESSFRSDDVICIVSFCFQQISRTVGARIRHSYNVYSSRLSGAISSAVSAGQRTQTAVSTGALIHYQQYKLLSAKAGLIDAWPNCTAAATVSYLSQPDMHGTK